MSKKQGRSCSTYFNGEQVERLESEAKEAGVGFKEILKAKAVAEAGTVQVVHKFNLGNEVKENLFEIASLLLTIRSTLNVANDEFLMPDDVSVLRENNEKSLIMFEEALSDMRKQVRSNAG